MTAAEYAQLADRLNLTPAWTDPDRVHTLMERLLHDLHDLEHMQPTEGIPTATLLRLRACKQEEIQVCQQALKRLGRVVVPS